MLTGFYDFKTDIWSCGVLLFYMLGGRCPFNSDFYSDTVDVIKNHEIYFRHKNWRKISMAGK